jgi:hypothetical protein
VRLVLARFACGAFAVLTAACGASGSAAGNGSTGDASAGSPADARAGDSTATGANGIDANANSGADATAPPPTGGDAASTSGSRTGGTDAGRGGEGGSSSGTGEGAGGEAGLSPGGGARDASAGETSTSAAGWIENDTFWTDTDGNPMFTQGGGVLQVGTTYYWYGVEYGGAATYQASPRKDNSDTTFVAVPCYSSTDLVHWKFEGNALTSASIGATGWVGRVGAAYNATTKKYVLVMQYTGNDGTGELFATSTTPNGAFAFDNVQATIANVVNDTSGDQAVFNDDDGQAYLVFSNSSGRSHLYVAPLRAADFLAVDAATEVYSSSAGGREGNCMFKFGGRYYLNSSDLHGWNASHTYSISAANIMGPYSTELVIGNTDADFSHVAQSGLFVTVHGTAQTTVIFGGDRWSDFAGNGIGYNEWVPLTFDGTTPSMASLSEWSIDATTGAWSVGPGNNYVLNPSFEADRVTMTQPAGWVTSTTTGGTPFTNASGGRTGNWKWQLTDTAAYEARIDQTVTNLPDGSYTLGAWVESSGGQSVAQLFATGFGGAEMDASIEKVAAWTHVSIAGIQVTSGTIDVGVTTTADANQWISADDFTLVKN